MDKDTQYDTIDTQEKTPRKQEPRFFSLSKGLALSAHITGYILGPLIIMGLIGYYVGNMINRPKATLVVALLISFFASNFLIYKRAEQIAKKYKN